MKTKKEIEKELEIRVTKLFADYLPALSEERQRNVDYDKGYLDALKWILEKSRRCG